MAKIDEPWNPEVEKPLAIAMHCPSAHGFSRFVMTTSLGRVLMYSTDNAGPRVWHDITPEFVRKIMK
jgi:hypothetical protein